MYVRVPYPQEYTYPNLLRATVCSDPQDTRIIPSKLGIAVGNNTYFGEFYPRPSYLEQLFPQANKF